jgi:hypothetical protein
MADGQTRICATLVCQNCKTAVPVNPASPADRRYSIPVVRRNGDFQDMAAGDRIPRTFLDPMKLELLILNEDAYLLIDEQTLPLGAMLNPLLLRIVALEERLAALESGS